MRHRFLCILLGLCGCAGQTGPGPGDDGTLDSALGTYRGSFDSALTADAADDLNFNPCNPEGADCLTHHQPLADILLTVTQVEGSRLQLRFFADQAAYRAGRALDLLGAGCGTSLGPASAVKRSGGHWQARVPLESENRLCLGKLRPTSRHHVALELYPSGDNNPARARVVIDKQVRDANFLYVMEDGVQRRVRIDQDNTVREGLQTHFRVCIENDLGEYERCVLTDREFKSFALPVPVPGGVAANYTWWYDLSPDLRRTRGRYELEQYLGRFERVGR